MKYSIFCLCFYNYGGVYDTWMREGTWEMAIESHVCYYIYDLSVPESQLIWGSLPAVHYQPMMDCFYF